MNADRFTGDDLREMVGLIGSELKAQDSLIRDATARNEVYKVCQGQGITYLKNEHYYQFAAVKALLPSFRFQVVPEFWGFDLAFLRSGSAAAVALGELKLWMSATGEQEIKGIIKDIEKLARKDCPTQRGCATFLLIFTVSPKGETEGNIKWLIDRLNAPFIEAHVLYQFDTKFEPASGTLADGEFAILAGFLSHGQAVAASTSQ